MSKIQLIKKTVARTRNFLKRPPHPTVDTVELFARYAQDSRSVDQTAAHLLLEGLKRLNPNDVRVLESYGTSLREEGRFAESAEALKKAIALRPDDVHLHTLLIHTCLDHSADRRALYSQLDQTMDFARNNAEVAKLLAIKVIEIEEHDTCFEFIKIGLGNGCRSVRRDHDVPGKYSAVIRCDPDGYDIKLASDFLPWSFLVDRIFCYAPYLSRLVQNIDREIVFRMSFGDFGDTEEIQLCFSGHKENELLVPDAIFVGSNAYRQLRARMDESRVDFSSRRDTAYWRGSLTGQADNYREIMELPRIHLCLHALQNERLDAKIVDVSQFGPWLPKLLTIVENLNIYADREPETENNKYKLLIDIDGNTNSWPGLWLKLYSGGAVVKLRSPFRQWYYDRLIDGENILMVDNLHDELRDSISLIERSPDRVEALAKRGRELAKSMSLQSEFKSFYDQALLCDQIRRTSP